MKAFKGGASLKTQRLKLCGNENLDQALYTWFVQMRQQGVPVSGPVLREKALRYERDGHKGFHCFQWLVQSMEE